MGALKQKLKTAGKVSGRPAKPNANSVCIVQRYRPPFINLFDKPLTPEENKRNKEYAAKRLADLNTATRLSLFPESTIVVEGGNLMPEEIAELQKVIASVNGNIWVTIQSKR